MPESKTPAAKPCPPTLFPGIHSTYIREYYQGKVLCLGYMGLAGKNAPDTIVDPSEACLVPIMYSGPRTVRISQLGGWQDDLG